MELSSDILDHTLHSYLHSLIGRLPANQQIQLKSLKLCGSKIIPQKGLPDNVFLIKKEDTAKFVGVALCKNPFACPVCSAYVMAKYRDDIATGIELMRKKGYIGFMMTFTVPHTRNMSCREVTDILYKTYTYYRSTAKTTSSNPNKKGSISRQFYQEVKIEHSVTVCEYTWGINGWHPHFHMIAWTKRENADKILKWEDKLNDFWTAQSKRAMYKVLSESGNTKVDIEKLYSRLKEPDTGIYISKKDGAISESLVSDYIAGWGADKEVTGNYRKSASHQNHYTPYQILEKAYLGDKQMERLYIEFCLQVTKKPVHHRVIWSRTGIKKQINVAKQQKKASEFLKKKESEAVETAQWRVVCYFTSEEWSKISELNRSFPIKGNILYLAVHAPHLLPQYLDCYDIVFDKPTTPYCQLIEDLFNEVNVIAV